jgi:lipopolysaccharide export system protein LptC
VYLPEPRTLISLALLVAGAVGSGLLLLNTGQDKQEPEPPELSLAFYLNQAELTGTGPSGEIVYQVWTEKAAQSASDESIAMDRVRMVYGQPDSIPWKLRANSGSIPASARIIRLSGDVVATAVDGDSNKIIIRTQQMDIDPAIREASARREVAIDYNGRVLNAVGMRANLESKQLTLLADVNGQFTP